MQFFMGLNYWDTMIITEDKANSERDDIWRSGGIWVGADYTPVNERV